jgi:hypothetical protein
VTWNGPNELRGWLFPIADLEEWPGNPRVGSVKTIRASLERFGQMSPVVARDEDCRILKGRHVTAAAAALGWSHVAVTFLAGISDVDAELYLMADNRASDLAQWDVLKAEDMVARLAEHTIELPELHLGAGWIDEMKRQAATQWRDGEEAMGEPEFVCPACGYGWRGNPA